MRFETADPKNRGFSTVKLSHGHEELTITVTGYSKIKIYSDPFFEINQYVATMSMERQAELFGIYKELEEDFITETGFRIESVIHKAIAAIYKVVDMQQFTHWLFTNTSFIIPSKTEEDDEARTKSRDMNYDATDYRDLALFSLALRFLIPIWGQLADESSEVVTNNKFFELRLVRFVENTVIETLPAWDKLLRYCEASFNSTANRNDKCEVFGNILQGLASIEIPDWIRAKAVFRKIHVFPIFEAPGNSATHTLIASLHYEVKGSLQSNSSKRAADKLRPKRNISDDSSEEERNSNLEQYKIKQRTIESHRVMCAYYTKDLYRAAERLDPTIPKDLIEECRRSIYLLLESEIIHRHQIVLLQWVLCPVLTPRTIPRLPRANLCNMIALTQAALWHWGFKEIAILLTVARNNSDTAMISAPPAKKGVFSKTQVEELKGLFPHEHPPTTVRDSQESKLIDLNFAINEIHELAEFMFRTTWRYIGPKKFIKEVPELSATGALSPPGDLRVHLMELAVLVAKRFDNHQKGI